jgi:hypothetical protein
VRALNIKVALGEDGLEGYLLLMIINRSVDFSQKNLIYFLE